MGAFRFDFNSSVGYRTVIEPIGWSTRKPAIERNEVYHGIFTSFTIDLTFIDGNIKNISSEIPSDIERAGAYTYLEELYESEGVLAYCEIYFYEYDNSIHDWVLQDTGVIDFTTRNVVSTIRGGGVEYAILETEFKQKMKAREDIEINYNSSKTLDNQDMDNPTYFDCKIKGMPIADSGIESDVIELQYISNSVNSDNHVISVYTNLSTPFQDVSARDIGSGFTLFTSDCYYYTQVGGRIKSDFDIAYSFDGDNPLISEWFVRFELYLYEFDENGNIVQLIEAVELDYVDSPVSNRNFTYTYDRVLDSRIQGLIFVVRHGGLIVGVQAETKLDILDNSSIVTDYTDSYDPTTSKVTFPYEVLSRLKESMTGDTTPIDAEIFNRPDTIDPSIEYGKYSLYSLMNGLLIRNFTQEESALSFKWRDLYLDLEKMLNIGLGIENDTIIVKDKKDFYTEDIVHTFENSSVVADSFEKRLELEYFYSDVEIGYAKNAYDEISGLLEFNTTTYWNTYLSKLSETMEYISDTRTDGYGVEFARRLQAIVTGAKNNDTTDSDYDEDNFMVEAVYDETDGYIQRDKEGFDSVQVDGVDVVNPVMNLTLTPAQNIRRHGWMLLTGLQKYADQVIKHNKSDSIVNLVTVKDGVTVDEQADINYTDLDIPIFSGHIIEVEVKASLSIYATIKANPYGLIKVWNEVEDKYNYGWIKSFSIESVDKASNLTLIEARSVSEVLESWLWNDGSEILWQTGEFIALNN